MTRSNSVYMLRRAYERVVASLGALAVTALMLFSVNAQAAPLSAHRVRSRPASPFWCPR